eukprot:270638_1
MAQRARSNKKPPLKPTVTETHRTLDLSSFIVAKHVSKFKFRNKIHTDTFQLDDLVFEVNIHSSTDNNASGGIGLYIGIKNASENDRRIMYADATAIGKHNKRYVSQVYSVHQFENGTCTFGWPDFIRLAELKHPNIQICIKLFHDPLLIFNKPSQTIQQQQEKMHQLSELHGDVTLIIKQPQNLSTSPMRKRRKLDNNNNSSNNNDGVDSDDNEIKVSSVILRSASEVFDRMLANNMMEHQKRIIEIEAHCLDDARAFVYFMSTNKLRGDANALNIIHLAHYYQMDRLFDACATRLIKNLSVVNFVDTIHTFDKFEITHRYDVLMDFAKKHAKELKTLGSFERLSHTFKCAVLNKYLIINY